MAQQQIHIASKSYRLPHDPSYVVLVMSDDAERGEYYRVSGPVLLCLYSGKTPTEMELEPLNAEDE